ncbi:hypothetical protein [Bacillus cereus]
MISHYITGSFVKEDYILNLNQDELFVLLGEIKATFNAIELRFDRESIINEINKSVENKISQDKKITKKLELYYLRFSNEPASRSFHRNIIELVDNECEDYSKYKEMVQKKIERHPRGILFSILRTLIKTEGGFINTRYIIDKYRDEILNAKELPITEKNFTYLVKQLDIFLSQQWTLKTVLERYKTKVHNFDRLRLQELVSNKSQKEKPLQLDLANYLFNNGYAPFIEVTNYNERFDILVDYNGKHIVEVKVYDGNLSKIKNGFKQIYSYTTKHGQRVGYYVIFQINIKDKLDFPFYEIKVNDRIIYCFSIDITGISGSVETRKSVEINQEYVDKVLMETTQS